MSENRIWKDQKQGGAGGEGPLLSQASLPFDYFFSARTFSGREEGRGRWGPRFQFSSWDDHRVEIKEDQPKGGGKGLPDIAAAGEPPLPLLSEEWGSFIEDKGKAVDVTR